MEQKRKILILSSVLALLVITFIAGLLFNAERRYNRRYTVQLFSNLQEGNIYAIELDSGVNGQIRLGREGNRWNVIIDGKSYPGDDAKVDNFMNEIVTLETRRFVTDNKGRYGDLGLDEDKRKVSLFDGDGLLVEEIQIGDSENSESEYIRIADSNKVYSVEPVFAFYVNQDNPYWSDLNIFPASLKEEEIIRIDIQCENLKLEEDKPPVTADYTIVSVAGENGNSGWRFESEIETEPSTTEVLSLINACTGLRAERFETEVLPRQREGIAKLEITTGNNSVYRFFVEARGGDNSYLCSRDGVSFSYELRNWNLARIFKPIEEISGS